jgi:methylated-DNA-[protein]-cysteine S-methyltransferase
MIYTSKYTSPLGGILLAADEVGLRGLWFDGQKYFARDLLDERTERETPVLSEAKRWLDLYFGGQEPDFLPPLHPVGTPFRQAVWEILLRIPYGKTVTYGEISKQLAEKMGLERMSAQAVGGAVGHNEISIIIPCHRVVGSNGSLTGYAGGIDRKIKLLELEHADMSRFFVPKKGTAL